MTLERKSESPFWWLKILLNQMAEKRKHSWWKFSQVSRRRVWWRILKFSLWEITWSIHSQWLTVSLILPWMVTSWSLLFYLLIYGCPNSVSVIYIRFIWERDKGERGRIACWIYILPKSREGWLTARMIRIFGAFGSFVLHMTTSEKS